MAFTAELHCTTCQIFTFTGALQKLQSFLHVYFTSYIKQDTKSLYLDHFSMSNFNSSAVYSQPSAANFAASKLTQFLSTSLPSLHYMSNIYFHWSTAEAEKFLTCIFHILHQTGYKIIVPGPFFNE